MVFCALEGGVVPALPPPSCPFCEGKKRCVTLCDREGGWCGLADRFAAAAGGGEGEPPGAPQAPALQGARPAFLRTPGMWPVDQARTMCMQHQMARCAEKRPARPSRLVLFHPLGLKMSPVRPISRSFGPCRYQAEAQQQQSSIEAVSARVRQLSEAAGGPSYNEQYAALEKRAARLQR
jgi:hypothetical protein